MIWISESIRVLPIKASAAGFTWLGSKRLAVYVALCVEHFSYGSGLGLPYSPGLSHPNSYNWGWREYGNRVGGWRLLELLEEFGVPLSVLLNTACYDHCPELIAAIRARGELQPRPKSLGTREK